LQRRNRIDLCPDGHFKYYDNSSMSFDTGGVFGHSSGSDIGSGKWHVEQKNGKSTLVLSFNNGKKFQYMLSLQDGKTYLDHTRYFRTYGTTANDGPHCP
ncbi:MAG: hypothetical protein HC896_11400, partial [Bacteroidales bacterium]|nr:hypothetical protein [Bacteroidales bacterium]